MPGADFDAAVKASRQLKAKPSNDELLEVRSIFWSLIDLHAVL
jgi:acyl-CoA-binding protein